MDDLLDDLARARLDPFVARWLEEHLPAREGEGHARRREREIACLLKVVDEVSIIAFRIYYNKTFAGEVDATLRFLKALYYSGRTGHDLRKMLELWAMVARQPRRSPLPEPRRRRRMQCEDIEVIEVETKGQA